MDYIKPEIEIIVLQQDVITLSLGGDDGNTPSVDYDTDATNYDAW